MYFNLLVPMSWKAWDLSARNWIKCLFTSSLSTKNFCWISCTCTLYNVHSSCILVQHLERFTIFTVGLFKHFLSSIFQKVLNRTQLDRCNTAESHFKNILKLADSMRRNEHDLRKLNEPTRISQPNIHIDVDCN